MSKQYDLHNYGDIIDMPHHVSATRRHMSLVDRGAQFSPFSALTGYDAAVAEAGRLTDARIELSDDAKDIIDGRLRMIAEHIADAPEVTVLHFVPDSRKEGGAYTSTTGQVRALDEYRRCLIFSDGSNISIDAIRALDGELFANMI